jgi:hypothetical protein
VQGFSFCQAPLFVLSPTHEAQKPDWAHADGRPDLTLDGPITSICFDHAGPETGYDHATRLPPREDSV